MRSPSVPSLRHCVTGKRHGQLSRNGLHKALLPVLPLPVLHKSS
ncbi:hypothetical protein EVA_15346 [gut metagenome]|uniref:Uncharacterized protein n=1 Tax=gut metagenome TaxID=749906 RepID=J9G424_9ZZZZ